MLECQNKHPNNGELELMHLLDEVSTGSFEINIKNEIGRRDNLNFGGIIPDFVSVSRRKVILYNGCDWHCCKVCGGLHPRKISEEDVWRNDEDCFNKLMENGWDILVLWEHDWINLTVMKNKIIEFLDMN